MSVLTQNIPAMLGFTAVEPADGSLGLVNYSVVILHTVVKGKKNLYLYKVSILYTIFWIIILKQTQTGWQAGSLIIPPINAAYNYFRSRPVSVAKVLRASTRGSLILAGVSGVLGVMRLCFSATPITVYDRAYRLEYNHTQNRVDAMSLIGAFGGLAFGLATSSTIGIPARLYLVPGTALGVIMHMAL